VKKRTPPAGKASKTARKPATPDAPKGEPRSGGAPKSSFELAMERLRAADQASGVEETRLSPAQKKEVAEARRVATSRLAEREILFGDAMRKTQDPEEREKAEREYQVDRQRIQDDCERAIDAIRRGGKAPSNR
jgi:hypothetical protein